MKIAIVGSGISGLSAAYFLDQNHEVTVFEAATNIGGHTHTVAVKEGAATIWVDTGFIVCNPYNYPNFFLFMDLLNVELQESNMSFSVSVPHKNLEYNGTSVDGLFAQRANLVNFKFLRMLKDIAKFNKHAKQYVFDNINSMSLNVFVKTLNLSEYFVEYYLAPMVSAIWSNDKQRALDMPALFVCSFLDNHGMLNVNDRPQWYCVQGGSHAYVQAILSKLKQSIRNNTQVTKIIRQQEGIIVEFNGMQESFDKVIIATHSYQALKLLSEPTTDEQNILSGLRYQENEVVLHTDITLLPKNRRAWASWNYKINEQMRDHVSVTYNMNILQNLNTSKTYCVSLNQTEQIDPAKIIAKFNYAHPIYDQAAIASQKQFTKISGVNNTYYCGAYWGSGFHEDGLNSGLRVVRQIDKENIWIAPFSVAG